MTMIGNIGRYTANGRYIVSFEGLDASFRKEVTVFVVAVEIMSRGHLGTNEAPRVWIALCERWVESFTPRTAS